MNRFWTKFYIFSAIHIGALVGFMTNAKFLVANIVIFGSSLILMIIFSIVGVISIFRGYDLQQTYMDSLKEIEKSLEKNERLIELVVRFMKLPPFLNTIIIISFTILICIFWVSGLVYLEAIDFRLNIPDFSQKTLELTKDLKNQINL